jgi:trk system potassium uptake protein TrkH
MLTGTAGLLIVGGLGFLVLEWRGTLRGSALGQRILVSFFHSITARTAGFNTIDIGGLTNATLFVTILLMVVGAGPCSTAGGFKVSTLMMLLARAWSTVRGHSHVHVYRRRVPDDTIHRAITTALVFTVVTIIGLTMLLVFEQSMVPHPQSQDLFMDAMFEVVSALGTVGLSTGLTPHLTDAGRIVIILLMIIGRLGPISVVVALSRRERAEAIEMPQEEPLIG